jgi:1-deoxy-D-xylulose-5-phosphate reductoisomerase
MSSSYKQQICILGATGSIGKQTLDIVKQAPERFQVFGLSAHSQVEKMLQLCLEFKPKFAVMSDINAAASLEQQLAALGSETRVQAGPKALVALAEHPDVDQVMAGIVGSAGMPSTFAAVSAGKKVLLANKETLVSAGSLLMPLLKTSKAILIPVDSEHNALFQCLPKDYILGTIAPGLKKMWLTASGGPFRKHTLAQLAAVSPEEACLHPNWQMGAKISVDSASLMNKGLELIEAHFLFGLNSTELGVLVHPQSAVHGLVQYEDGSLIAGLSAPDMRVPIAHAMAWPDRIAHNFKALDLISLGSLTFEAPDLERFPCLALAQEVLDQDQSSMLVLNAANEVAVEAFLKKKISFLEIPKWISYALEHFESKVLCSLDAILDQDQEVRIKLREKMAVGVELC